MLAVHSIAHFLVDALCVSTLFSCGAEGDLLSLCVILYNTVAFSSQCLVGLAVDRLKHELVFFEAAILFVVFGFVLPLPPVMRVCLCAAGNSVFHVAAGAVILKYSGGKAKNFGIFVAPGAFGVTLGTVYPSFGLPLAVILLICAAAACCVRPGTAMMQECHDESENAGKPFPLLPVLLLVCAVAVRAVGGAAVSFPWKSGVRGAFLLTAFVFGGKLVGGFICDCWNVDRTAWISIPLAAVCIGLFSDYAVTSLLGQFLLNLTMPVTLWLLYRVMPDSPGFSFGLAASALWPGTIAGMLLKLTGPVLSIAVVCCFAFGLFAILYAAKKLSISKGEM